MLLANNCPDLYALCSAKNYLFLAQLPEILVNSDENYRRYYFQAFANISGNIKFPENLQP